MTLTAGATLQNGKYVIQSLLKQSDFGITYRAVHFYLEQPVIIQTFNDSLRHHANFEQLRQLFISELRRRAKVQDGLIKVLDGFEEGEMPYLVIPYEADQPLPKLRDWLPVSKLVVTPPSPPGTESLASANTTNGKTALAGSSPIAPASIPESAPSTNGKTAPASDNQPSTPPGDKTEANKAGMDQGVSVIPGLSAEPLNPQWTTPIEATTNGVTLSVLPTNRTQKTGEARSPQVQPKPKTKRLLPIALGLTAFIGGLSGVAFGWTLRFSDTAPVSTDGNPASIFDFNDEQAFPAQGNWPITDTSELESTSNRWDDSEYEAPVQRDRPRYEAAPEWSAPVEEVPYSEPEPVPEEAVPYEEVAPAEDKVIPPEQFSDEAPIPNEISPPVMTEPPIYEPPSELPPKPAIEDPPAAVNSLPESVIIPPDATFSQ